MKQKSPAFQFYSNDFLAGRVATYSLEEVGLYSLLLAFDWSLTGLPLDAEKLARLSRVSVRKFSTLWSVVSEQFIERDGRYYNPRLDLERRKQSDYSDKMSENGKLGGRPRVSRGLAEASFPESSSSSSSSSRRSRDLAADAANSPSFPAEVSTVLEHYRARHPQRRPGAKEAGVVARALGLGYSSADLCEAIDGNAKDSWHASRGKHEIGYVFRDADHIDTARTALALKPPPSSNGALSKQEVGRLNLAEAIERRKRDGTAITEEIK